MALRAGAGKRVGEECAVRAVSMRSTYISHDGDGGLPPVIDLRPLAPGVRQDDEEPIGCPPQMRQDGELIHHLMVSGLSVGPAVP